MPLPWDSSTRTPPLLRACRAGVRLSGALEPLDLGRWLLRLPARHGFGIRRATLGELLGSDVATLAGRRGCFAQRLRDELTVVRALAGAVELRLGGRAASE